MNRFAEQLERLEHPYPLVRTGHRRLQPDYEGPIFVWDIDKTYLDTRFSQLKELLKIPLEFGVDKRAYPGVARLLRVLRAGVSGRGHHPLFFISASPPQLRRPVERKMLIDGIEFDGITFKDPLRLLLSLQFDQLWEQVAFKLSALLLLRRDLPAGGRLHLFGDDAERDALIYSLFGDTVAGRLRGRSLVSSLVGCGVKPAYARAIEQFAAPLPPCDRVAGIYIHLVRHPDGSSIREFGPPVVGWPNAAAAAQALHSRGLMTDEQRRSVEQEAAPVGTVEPEATDADEFFTPASYRQF